KHIQQWPAAKENARLLADEDPRVNGSCISVLNLLLAEIDRRTGVVRPSPRKHAAHMRCGHRTVTNALARLEDCGLILRRPATDSGRQAEVTLPCLVAGAIRAERAKEERLKQREGRAK